MEPTIAAAAYTLETAAEGAVAAAMAIAKPTMPLKGSPWKKIPTDVSLPRSSHTLTIIKGKAYIFGGECKPRQPVDNNVHVFTLPQSEHDETDYQAISPLSAKGSTDASPSPRFGHTATAIDDRIYIFGGRGGNDMAALDEKGRVWVFDTSMNRWSFLDPIQNTPYPASRSYHTSTSTVHPLSGPIDPNAETTSASISGFDDHGTVFIHGGCTASERHADVWGFDVAAQTWSQYPQAPGPARGGTALCFAQDRLYRFGGFDGHKELGGLQCLYFVVATHDDKAGKGEMAITPKTGKWETVEAPDGTPTPGDRSVAGLHPVTTGQGRHYLLLFLGEKFPSASGHDGAGKFWDDVWSFQLKPEGMSAASFKDATRWLVGAKTAEGSWAKVDIPESTMTEGRKDRPGARGWFASCQAQDLDPASIVLWGGIREDNQRLGDGWILTLDT